MNDIKVRLPALALIGAFVVSAAFAGAPAPAAGAGNTSWIDTFDSWVTPRDMSMYNKPMTPAEPERLSPEELVEKYPGIVLLGENASFPDAGCVAVPGLPADGTAHVVVTEPAYFSTVPPGCAGNRDQLCLSPAISPRDVVDWRESMPGVSYSSSQCPVRRFGHDAVFFPDIPSDADLAGYAARVVDGVAISYAEVTDAATPPPATEVFSARAADWIGGEKGASAARVVRERLRDTVGLSETDVELARHTTVRRYPGTGEVAVTTVLYQRSSDGDMESEYFCIGSYVAMTPENGSENRDGWKNSEFSVSYDLNAAEGSLQPSGGIISQSSPQTSPGDALGGLLNSVDIFGALSGLFGHSVRVHHSLSTDVADDRSSGVTDLSWVTECGYFTAAAAGSLNLTPVSEIVTEQPTADDTEWRVLAKVDIDAASGWSRLGGCARKPILSSPWGHFVLIRTAGEV